MHSSTQNSIRISPGMCPGLPGTDAGLPGAADGIGVERGIAADERHVLDDGLRNEHSVEGIAVVERQEIVR